MSPDCFATVVACPGKGVLYFGALEGSEGKARMRRTPLAALWAAVLATGLVTAASADAAATLTNAFPPKLVGTWTRTPTKADVTREEANPTIAGSHCTLTIKTSGAAHIVCAQTPGLNFAGKFVPKGPSHVQIVFADLSPNSYSWHVSGRQLILKKVVDPTPDRSATMSGTWTRK